MTVLPESYSGRILVVRLSAMGDVAMTSPVVAQLRRNYPHVRIVILTVPFLRPFFKDIEGVEFFTPDFNGRHKGVLGAFRLSMDLGRFDMVADLHDVLRSKMLRRVLKFRGAKVAYIDKGREEKKTLTDLENKQLVPLKSTVERYRDVFLALGFDLPPIQAPQRFHYPMSESVVVLAGAKKEVWIGIAPFAQHQGKIYPVDQMERVIASLSEIPGVRIFIFGGGDQEREYAELVEKKYRSVTSVIGRIKLTQEMELISHLDGMVSMDSSAMHMASLVGVPVVSVWGATHPFAGFYGLGQDPVDAVQLDMPCRPCSIYGNKPCALGDYPCMRNIAPETIVQRVCKLLNLETPQ